MLQYINKMIDLKRDEKGVTALEYGLIAALIAVVIIGAVTTLGSNLSNTFTTVSGKFGATGVANGGATTAPASK